MRHVSFLPDLLDLCTKRLGIPRCAADPPSELKPSFTVPVGSFSTGSQRLRRHYLIYDRCVRFRYIHWLYRKLRRSVKHRAPSTPRLHPRREIRYNLVIYVQHTRPYLAWRRGLLARSSTE